MQIEFAEPNQKSGEIKGRCQNPLPPILLVPNGRIDMFSESQDMTTELR